MYSSLENEWRVGILPLLAPKKTSIRSSIFAPAINRIASKATSGSSSLSAEIVSQIEKESLLLANYCHRRSPHFPGITKLIQSWYPYPAQQVNLPGLNQLSDSDGFSTVIAAAERLNPDSADCWNRNRYFFPELMPQLFPPEGMVEFTRPNRELTQAYKLCRCIYDITVCGAKRYQFLYVQIFPFWEGSLPLPRIGTKI